MKNEVDWSTAPEWANVRLQHVQDGDLMAWAASHKDGALFVRDDISGESPWRLIKGYWVVVEERPQHWRGPEEGLPPVGTYIEWLSAQYGWLGGRVVGHDGMVTVVSHNDGYTGCHAHEVRPIRTPEQIAAEEREKAIDSMAVAADPVGGAPETCRLFCKRLYDHGYRKTEGGAQ